MFPGANAQIYTNEAGEPIGWDYPSYDEPSWADDDWANAQNYEMEPEELEPWECLEKGLHGDSGTGTAATSDWWSPITDSYENGHPQYECDYCGAPFWLQW